MPVLLGLVAACAGLATPNASATNLNVFAGTHIHAHEYGLATVELTMPEIAEVGPFFEWSRSTAPLPDDRYVAGLMARVTTPWLNFFCDARAGYDWNGLEGSMPGRDGFELELGAGYRFVGRTFDVLPRLGVTAVRANGDVPRVDLSVGVAIVL